MNRAQYIRVLYGQTVQTTLDPWAENSLRFGEAETVTELVRFCEAGAEVSKTEMISAAQAAEKWGVTVRRVQDLCKRGEIKDAQRFGRAWMIPANTVYPYAKEAVPESSVTTPRVSLLRDSPFLYMTDIYNTPGTADECAAGLAADPVAALLFEDDISLCRGDVSTVYEHSKQLTEVSRGFYADINASMQCFICAQWNGDVELWKLAKKHIYEIPCKDDADRDILSMTVAVIDNMVYDKSTMPDWFERGCFGKLPADAQPAARVYYVKYLYMEAHDLAVGQLEMQDAFGLVLMRVLPYIIEPMIAQCAIDRTVVVEIYLRLYCAAAYHHTDDDRRAAEHIDKALTLALPDGLYGILAECRSHLDTLLIDRIMLFDPRAAAKVKSLHKTYSEGWAKLQNGIKNRYVCTTLSSREREVARLAAFGLTNRQIAERLHIAESTVKQAVRGAVYKSGVADRDELYSIL